jgi:hemerythrin-like domain-containing protein
MKPTEDLMNDHAAIMIILNIMGKIANQIRAGRDFNHVHVENIIGFLKNFADKCHHGKEETVLFPAMENAGISRDNGPVGVMLYEHTVGREFISQMTDALNKSERGEGNTSEALAEAMIQYVNLLQNHIMKENNILFPMADNVLDDVQQREILLQFEEIENNVVGQGVHEQYHRMIHELEKDYLS